MCEGGVCLFEGRGRGCCVDLGITWYVYVLHVFVYMVLCVCVFFHLFVHVLFCLSVHGGMSLFVCLYISIPVHVSVCVRLSVYIDFQVSA